MAVTLLVVALLALGPPIVATAAPGTAAGTTDDVAAAADLGAFSGPIRFEAPDGVAVTVADRRYVGTIEARVGRDGGVTLVDELAFDEYLEGLAEVPVSWHVEALEAQVVAARTYAWWELQQGAWADGGFDLCGTQACQVFAGRDVVEDDAGGRWAAAVAATSGEVLVDDDGAPLLARYSSSNGGASVANVEVFPDDGDPPYLQSVDDPYDAVSPWHRWEVTFPRADMDAILARGERLAAAVPFADIRRRGVPDGEDLVVVTGEDGTEVAVTTTEFRFLVTRHAPTVDPSRYPAERPDAEGRYPATLLSQQLSFEVRDDEVVVSGRGFGHGVGMSQYGMLGRAEAGQRHEEILAAYYGGTEPTTPAAVPDVIRVGFVLDVDDVTVELPSPVPVVVGDTVITPRGLGSWTVRRRPDRTMQLLAPDGFGAPLVVDPTTTTATSAVLPSDVVRLETVVNKPVELVVEVRDADGTLVGEQSAGVVEAGRHRVDASLAEVVDWAAVTGPDDPDELDERLSIALVGIDEEASRGGSPTTVTVVAEGAVGGVLGSVPAAARALVRSPPLLVAVLVGALGGILLGVAPGVVRARRRRDPPSQEHT